MASPNPKAKIFILTPINCSAYGTQDGNWGLSYSFSNNGTLEDIFDAEKTIAEYYGIELIDMTHNSVINRISAPHLMADGISSSQEEIRSIMKGIRIGCYSNTLNELRKCAGEEIEARVLREIIRENKRAFDRGLSQKEGYRLGILKNLVRDNYKATQEKLDHLESMGIPIPCDDEADRNPSLESTVSDSGGRIGHSDYSI